ncbi:MAG: polysaccharide biosynthesis C-terminal domain-containing protein [Bacteroidota bacterium]
MIGANIIRTFFSRSGTAVINLVVVIMSARLLGDVGMGMISLLVLTVTLNALFVGLFAGAGLIYLTPRHPVKNLLVIGYLWSIIVSLIVVFIFQYFALFPAYFGNHVYLLVIINSFGNINMYILLGRQRIKAHNIITFIQSLLLLLTILFQFYIISFVEVEAYLWALYVSFAFVWLSSTIVMLNSMSNSNQKSFKETLKHTYNYSLVLQTGSGVQLLNNRLSYYIIDYFLGTAMLGRFSVAVQVAEGILILAKSFGLVLYSSASNIDNIKQAIKTSIPLFKITAYATIVATVVILLLPSDFFSSLFGKDFSHIHEILLFLAPGIVFVSATMLFSSFFAGVGMIKINTQGSVVGLMSTLLLSIWMIYYFGLVGAAIATSLSYLSSLVYAQYHFKKVSGFGLIIYKVSVSDFQQIKLLLKGLFSKK